MDLLFRPLDPPPAHWRRAHDERPTSPFDATYSQTLELLERELRELESRESFLQVVAGPSGVRLDGRLRANAVVDHPGVMLTIDSRAHGTLVYETDRFGRKPAYKANAGPAWQENLRAIALGLEALRKVERYGIASRGQQYAGYRELGAGGPIELGSAMTLEEAAELLFPDDPERLIDFPDEAAERFRWLAKKAHPDAGGDAEIFRRLTEARDLLTRQATA
jgi:hypothetical protein